MRRSAIIQSAVAKLTLYYVAIIMFLSIGFSLILYGISSAELVRNLQRPPEFLLTPDIGLNYEQLRQARITQANSSVANNLVAFNLIVLAIGSGVSYLLARRTLQPIQDAMETQSRFTSDASHELRTPLTAMQTELEVALRNPKLSKVDMNRLLKSNLEEAIKLKTLSERLLQLARQNNQPLTLQPVLLEQVAIDALNNVIAAAQVGKIAIENTIGDITVLGDFDSLSSLFTILLDNAIKYSKRGQVITLSAQRKGKHVDIMVQDHGVGIKAKDLPYIFDRFYRGDQSRSKTTIDGHGLGLALAKEIAESNGGSIQVKSQVSKGSTFTVRLNAHLKPAANQPSAPVKSKA